MKSIVYSTKKYVINRIEKEEDTWYEILKKGMIRNKFIDGHLDKEKSMQIVDRLEDQK